MRAASIGVGVALERGQELSAAADARGQARGVEQCRLALIGVDQGEVEHHAAQVAVHAVVDAIGRERLVIGGGFLIAPVGKVAARLLLRGFAVQRRHRQQAGDEASGQRAQFDLIEQVEPVERQRPLQTPAQPAVGVGLAAPPAIDRLRAQIRFRVGFAAAVARIVAFDFLGLAQVRGRIDIAQAGMHLDQNR
ncbi:MAG: hypothetical protein JF591_14790, partial [Lysobacter sp.]|nr:hypothetical protein [Lysobacter sp.]